MFYIYNANYVTHWKVILMDTYIIVYVADWIDLTCFSRVSFVNTGTKLENYYQIIGS
jgi:hypothetical protein